MKTFKRILVAWCVLFLGIVPSHVSAFPANAPAPTITSISPTEAYNYQPTTITISGSNFVATPTINLNNVSLTNVTFVDATTLTATVPANLPGGMYSLTVTNPDMQSASLTNAFNAMLSGDGSLGNWQAMNSMTTGRFCLTAVAAQGNLYALGGFGDASVERAVINADGTLGNWQATTSMTNSHSCSAAVAVEGYLYVLGGTVERAAINTDGTLGAWQTMTSMNYGGLGLAGTVWNGSIYSLGGDTNGVERAIINSDGTLGAWEALSSMTTRRAFFGAIAAGGYLYAIGGWNGTIGLNSVERAPINADGTLGTWQVVSALSTARYHHAVVMSQGYIYVLGGYVNGMNVSSNGERATVRPDGTLSSWSTIPSMNTSRGDLGIAVAGSYLYVLGGFDQNPTWVTLNTVERATLSFDITPPTANSLAINGGALDTTATNVIVALSATDSDSGVADISLSNDGNTWDNWQPYAPTVTWTLSSGDGLKTVWGRVRDGAQHLSQVVSDTIALVTTVPSDYGVSINNGALFTNQTAVTLTIGARPGTAQMQVSNDGGFAGAQWEEYASHKAWTITQYGSYVIPRVVYVRYKDEGGNTSATFSDDIILDVTPPTGNVAIIGSGSSPARRANKTVTLALSATDDVSGVGGMTLSNRSDFAGASWQPFVTSLVWTLDSNNTVYVRFKDNAGNVSPTYSASVGATLFLPLIMR
jgi:hypothetical protein